MISNGNIQFFGDIDRCLEETGVDGIMSAEGILYNPSLFAGKHEPCWKVAKEYFDLFQEHHDLSVSRSCLRAHLFKIFHHVLRLDGNENIRDNLSNAYNYEEFSSVIDTIRNLYQVENEEPSLETSTLPLPVYICQPYFRPKPVAERVESKDGEIGIERIKRMSDDRIKVYESTVTEVSKKQAKKLLKLQVKKERKENKKLLMEFSPCTSCNNPRGLKCIHAKCRLCCITELKKSPESSCPGEKITFLIQLHFLIHFLIHFPPCRSFERKERNRKPKNKVMISLNN